MIGHLWRGLRALLGAVAHKLPVGALATVAVVAGLLASPAGAAVPDTPVNQPPVNTLDAPITRTVSQGTVIDLPTSFADPDVGSGTLDIEANIIDLDEDGAGPDGVVTPLSEIGQLRLNGANVGTDEVRTQNLSASNTLFATLQVALAPGYTGTFRVVIESDDNGNTGPGGELADTNFYTITVAPPDASLSIAPVTIVEGTSSGSTVVSLTVTRPTAAAVTCNVTAVASIGSGDTATAGDLNNFTVQNFLVSPDALSRTINAANIVADSLDESDETFTVTIAGAPFSTFPACDINPAANTATITIQDDDGPAPDTSLSIAPVTIVEGTSSGSTVASVTITRPTSAAVTCNFTAVATIGSGDTATAGDLNPVGNVQNFLVSPGALSRTVNATTIVADSLDESDETFTVTIAGAPFGTFPACDVNPAANTATITIQDDDGPAPDTSLSIQSSSITEGNTGTTIDSFTVTRPNPLAVTCGFRATITFGPGNTANAADFTDLTPDTHFYGVVTGPDGSFSIADIAGDTTVEPDETYTVTITGHAEGTTPACDINPAAATATGTILNDDAAAPDTSVSIASATIVEGTSSSATGAGVTITRPTSAAVTCNVTAVAAIGSGDSAVAGDLTTVNNVQNFLVQAGDLSRTVLPTSIIADSLDEPDETFTVTIAGAPFGSFPACDVNPAAATATITIQDDDDAPPPPTYSVSVGDRSVVEGTGSGTKTMSFPVTRTGTLPAGGCGARFTLTHAAANGTNAADFQSTAPMDVVITSSTTSLSRRVVRDSTVEPDERFVVTLSPNPAHANPCVIDDGAGDGTIVNDDAPKQYGKDVDWWKNHTSQWPSPYTPGTTLTAAGFVAPSCPGFSSLDLVKPNGTDTLLQALRYGGGWGLQGKARNLLRQAVAALLNEQRYGDGYGPYASPAALVGAVNATLATCNQSAYSAMADALERRNDHDDDDHDDDHDDDRDDHDDHDDHHGWR